MCWCVMSPVLQPLRFMENFSFFQLHSFLFYGHGCVVLAQHRFWFQQQSQKSTKTFRFLAKHCNTCLCAFKSTTAARSCVCCSVLWIQLISTSQTHNSCNTVVLQSECCLRSQPPSWIVHSALTSWVGNPSRVIPAINTDLIWTVNIPEASVAFPYCAAACLKWKLCFHMMRL